MELSLFQIDTFTQQVFKGNPAAVVPLNIWLDDKTLQNIAAENNLSETAYIVAQPNNSFDIRWFTPTVEVNLCGHATLAAAHALFVHLGCNTPYISFNSKSGELRVSKQGNALVLDFPAQPIALTNNAASFSQILGLNILSTLEGDDHIVVLATEQDIINYVPALETIKSLGKRGLIITAQGTTCDFVSRFFAPNCGINEDPVTGSAYCELTPYWAAVLGKNILQAKQVSQRGGELVCELNGNRVLMSGHAVTYMQGTIAI